MKAFYRLPTLALLALTPPAAFAQEVQPGQLNGQGTIVIQEPADPFAPPPPPYPPEKPFSLEFDGGAVREFVAAVEEATGAPFNVIIPASAQELQIPAVKVKGVTLRPLLAALSESSTERKAITTSQNNMRSMQPGGSNIQYADTGFSFTPSEPGPQAVWQLTVRGVPELPAPPAPPPTVRFYQLKPLLESGLKVEDITTAAETAWKMMKLAQADMPELKYHEETGLLIAAGSDTALTVIDSVLQAQPQQRPARTSQNFGPGGGGLRNGGGVGFGSSAAPPQILPPSPNVAPPPQALPTPAPRVPALPKN